MAKAVVGKPKNNATIGKVNEKKKKVIKLKTGPTTAPASKPTSKPTSATSPGKKQKNIEKKQKEKKDKKAISEDADENVEMISNEVGALLQRLKQDYDVSLSDEEHKVSGGKEKGDKKKITKKSLANNKPAPKADNASKIGQSNKAAKQTNKKILVSADDTSDSPKQIVSKAKVEPTKGTKGNNIKKNIKRAAEDNNASDESPSKLAKLTDDEKVAKKLQKKKNKEAKKKNQKQKVKLEKSGTDGEADGEKSVVTTKKEPKINKKTNKPFKAVPIHNVEGASSVYVGNLPLNISRKKIIKTFRKYGDILAVRICTNTGGRIYYKSSYDQKKAPVNTPFLIAFVCFKTEESAKKSLEENGTRINDNIIKVSFDKTNGVVGNDYHPKRTIFVGNLPYAANDAALREAFGSCGEIEHVRLLQCERGCKGTGYICFKEAESVSLALELNKTLVLNREINVERYHSKKLGRGVNGNEASKKGPNKKFVPKGSSGKNKTTIDHSPKKKKKQEFIGAKSDKKKKFQKKTKPPAGAKLLALKVAPKKEKLTVGSA